MDDLRKIQLTGRNTYIVSLPHSWISRNNIEKGQGVNIAENDDGTLLVSLNQKDKDLGSVTLTSSKNSPNTMRNLVSAYVSGCGKIVLKGENISTIAEEARRVLSGVEITDESNNELVLRILTFDDLNVDGIIKREFNVTNSMFTIVANRLNGSDDSEVEISRKEDDVDRLHLLLLRQVCLGTSSLRSVLFRVMISKSIEKMSDHLEELYLSGKEIGKNEELSKLVLVAQNLFSLSYDCFANSKIESPEYTQTRNEFLKLVSSFEEGLKKKKDKSEILALQSLLEKCIKLLRYSEDIVESSVDLTFSQPK